MNYDEARQMENAAGWHWTTKNDGRIRTAAPCIKHIGDETDPMWYTKPYVAADWERCEPHATKEEAERHFYDFCLQSVTEHESTRWMGCAKCDAPTKKMLGNMGLELLLHATPLCDEHRSREMLAELEPFKPEIKVVHS